MICCAFISFAKLQLLGIALGGLCFKTKHRFLLLPAWSGLQQSDFFASATFAGVSGEEEPPLFFSTFGACSCSLQQQLLSTNRRPQPHVRLKDINQDGAFVQNILWLTDYAQRMEPPDPSRSIPVYIKIEGHHSQYKGSIAMSTNIKRATSLLESCNADRLELDQA